MKEIDNHIAAPIHEPARPPLVHTKEDYDRAAREGIKPEHADYWASMREITRERQLCAALAQVKQLQEWRVVGEMCKIAIARAEAMEKGKS